GPDRESADEVAYTESGHIPAWADADPTSYWDAADLHERANGRLFKRLEFALPTALSADEQRELAVGFAHHVTDGEQLPYILAIHAGEGTNPHCHLLISERTNDGLERSPEQWFRRYNAAEPEQGGARKTTALRPRAWLMETREAWAEQANQALAEAGSELRIDHRSYAAQGIERVPGVHLGPTVLAMEARGIETERGAEARAIAQQNAELAAEARRLEAAAEAVPQEPAALAPSPSRWETVKERVGAWFSREQTPEAVPTPPAAQDAPSAAQDGPRPSSPAPDPAVAENAAPEPLSVDEAYRRETERAHEARQLAAEVVENYEAVAAQVAAIKDPERRAEAERLLETVRREETARRASLQQEPERGRDRDEGWER
ncbi:MAG: MobA/MobL family protein, partial [Gemmatimonadetes bacterium]|nr:MobA/MobL family protein [Gemmatimonadota bacterium]